MLIFVLYWVCKRQHAWPAADYGRLLLGSQSAVTPEQAAQAMLQLVFLMVHSLADEVRTKQSLRQAQSSNLPTHMMSNRMAGVAGASMPDAEDFVWNMKFYVGEPSLSSITFVSKSCRASVSCKTSSAQEPALSSTCLHLGKLCSRTMTGKSTRKTWAYIHTSMSDNALKKKPSAMKHSELACNCCAGCLAVVFLQNMDLMHKGPYSVSPDVWAKLDKGRWCHDQQPVNQLKQDLDCLRSAEVLPCDVINLTQSCFDSQVCCTGMQRPSLLHYDAPCDATVTVMLHCDAHCDRRSQ